MGMNFLLSLSILRSWPKSLDICANTKKEMGIQKRKIAMSVTMERQRITAT
jgi:hypothetical protein